MHSTRNSTLDGLGRLGAETDLRTDIKVWMEGEGGGGRRGEPSIWEWERASFLPHRAHLSRCKMEGLVG